MYVPRLFSAIFVVVGVVNFFFFICRHVRTCTENWLPYFFFFCFCNSLVRMYVWSSELCVTVVVLVLVYSFTLSMFDGVFFFFVFFSFERCDFSVRSMTKCSKIERRA